LNKKLTMQQKKRQPILAAFFILFKQKIALFIIYKFENLSK